MPPISEDTLALVAAQLVTAWAIKTGQEAEDREPHTVSLVKRFNTVLRNLKAENITTPEG